MTKSSFVERFGQREPNQAESPVTSGSSANLSLKAGNDFTATVTVARALIRRGVSPSVARSVVERLASGEATAVTVKHYDQGVFDDELAKMGLAVASQDQGAQELAASLAKARERVNMSQEQFASATGLKVATLRNWEQARGRRDASTNLLIKMLTAAPELAVKVAAGLSLSGSFEPRTRSVGAVTHRRAKG
jgi:putative transcriptional regulator